MPSTRYIKAAEIASDLGITRQAVYDLITAGALPALDVGSKDRAVYRIERVDYEAFVASRRTTLKAVGQ